MSRSSGDNRRTTPGYPSSAASSEAPASDGAPAGELRVSLSGGILTVPHDNARDSVEILGMAVGEQLDAFRELRTRLLAMGEDTGLHRFSVLVVPVTSGSGAGFVARNLAAAFTLQENRRAVLLDCNLRNPSQHLAFALLDDTQGLFDYLENNHTRAERLLHHTKLPGLYFIPAGTPSSSAREYFSSHAMRTLLTWLRKAPCFLVLDGPPSKGSPDARILSGLTDFVVLVAGYGRDTPDEIAKAAALFEPSKFAGVVFNNQV
jgi:protein-tyrosine kinase